MIHPHRVPAVRLLGGGGLKSRILECAYHLRRIDESIGRLGCRRGSFGEDRRRPVLKILHRQGGRKGMAVNGRDRFVDLKSSHDEMSF